MRQGFLAAAALLWLLFTAGVATGLVQTRGGGGAVLLVLAWHAGVGFLVARGVGAADDDADARPWEVGRTMALATAVSLALAYGVGLLLARGI